jgi:hypothetical protein
MHQGQGRGERGVALRAHEARSDDGAPCWPTRPLGTVVLNLQTGRYHGLNATAGSMLEALSA